MPFQKGNKLGKGQKKKVKTQVKDWIKAHPLAVSELMQALYDAGKKGDTESAKYVIDRIKGKPTAHTDITSDGEALGVGLVTKINELMSVRRRELGIGYKILSGGEDATEQAEKQGENEES